jgi:hypothetical protein
MKNNDFNENICLLVSSIRTFAGNFANSSIWILMPDSKEINKEMKEFLNFFNVKILDYSFNSKYMILPLIELVFASARAEKLAIDSFEFLVWLDSNTIILSEPKAFLLPDRILVGYRPVHHLLIGSKYDEAIDSFWKTLFDLFNISKDRFFKMTTHIDEVSIRPYFNAGCLVVRPTSKLLTKWKEKFEEFSLIEELEFYYKQNHLYKIFIHQAILSCTIISCIEQNQLVELSSLYNYPLHLHTDSELKSKTEIISKLVTARYEDKNDLKILFNNNNNNISFKNWLEREINTIRLKRN